MTLVQFQSCVKGWMSAHGAEEKPQPPSEQKFKQMLAEIEGQKSDV